MKTSLVKCLIYLLRLHLQSAFPIVFASTELHSALWLQWNKIQQGNYCKFYASLRKNNLKNENAIQNYYTYYLMFLITSKKK